MADLTDKQRRFCEEYVVDWNGTRAAIAAGYSKKTAKEIASQNLTKPQIKEYIEEVKNDLERLAGISKLKIIREHIKLAFSSIAHLHDTWITRKDFESLTKDQKECIAEIDTKILKKNLGTREEPEIVDVEYIRIKLYDKQKALDSISKLMGYDAPEKHEHTGKDGDPLFSGFDKFMDACFNLANNDSGKHSNQ